MLISPIFKPNIGPFIIDMHACFCYINSMNNETDIRKALAGLSQEQLIDMYCELDRKYNNLQAYNEQLKRKYFGVKNNDHVAKGQLSLFNEIEDTFDNEERVPEPAAEEVVPKKKKKKKNTPKNAKLKDVRVEEKHIYPEETICPICGNGMVELKPTVIEYLEYHQAEYVLNRFVVHNRTCHSCNEENMDCVIYSGDTSSLPARLIDSSIVTSSMISNIAANKFLLGLPYYRQSKDLEYRGIFISRQAMCQWLMRVGDDYLRIVYERMIRDLRRCEIINMDETTLECLEDVRADQRSKSYTWLAMSGKHEQNQMALYFYNHSREHKFVYTILGPSFTGTIQSDGYGAYDDYTPATGHAGCAAHCQRDFVDAAQSYTALYKKYTSTKNPQERAALREANPSFSEILHILDQFTKIYDVEHRLSDNSAGPEEILHARETEARTCWEEIRVTMEQIKQRYVISAKLQKAITYTENQWDKLLYYLSDWRLSPDNNYAEREGIKPYVMARKNYLFADTRHGAQVSSMYFSLLISARMNNLNPEKYLTYLLDQLSTYGITDEVIERCLPYSRSLPEDIKISKNHSS